MLRGITATDDTSRCTGAVDADVYFAGDGAKLDADGFFWRSGAAMTC